MRRKIIDISTQEKKKKVFDEFNLLSSKSQAHDYFGISDNKQGSEYLKEIASLVGFDLNIYKERKKKPIKFCRECGKEIKSKWAECFCCSSCAAKYNNRLRIKQTNKKENTKKEIRVKKEISIKKHNQHLCECCGKMFSSKNKNAKYCSNECSSKHRHEMSYKDFIENNEKYCRGNYTPKQFKDEFLKEQNNSCAICGHKPEHNGKPLIFVLDHIDGDASNNKRENLRLICPNCDSQLDTFKSKNKNSKRRNYWREHIIKQTLCNN